MKSDSINKLATIIAIIIVLIALGLSTSQLFKTKNIKQNLLPPERFEAEITPQISPETRDEKCEIGGCNGEICQNAGEKGGFSACIAKPEFACYKNAKCEVQSNDNCAWTQTEELNNCLQNKGL